ncbi:hypothetical protein SAMN05444166_0792 [Singulisphaera sp. GP187]|nr:hypothetical protein SAMN05444166_0792 [Singulisphaera sp. GP187]
MQRPLGATGWTQPVSNRPGFWLTGWVQPVAPGACTSFNVKKDQLHPLKAIFDRMDHRRNEVTGIPSNLKRSKPRVTVFLETSCG